MDAILLDKGIPGMHMERLRRASPFEMKVRACPYLLGDLLSAGG